MQKGEIIGAKYGKDIRNDIIEMKAN